MDFENDDNFGSRFGRESEFEDKTITETIAKVGRFAVHIERNEAKSHSRREQRRNRVNNSSSTNSPNPNQSSKEVPGTVGGFKINIETRKINNEAWKQMPEKDTLFKAKTKLRNEGVIFPGDTQPSNSNETANEEFTQVRHI